MDWKPWMDAFLPALLEAFPGRVAFVGIQGSYGRGEAGPDSDVDLVVVLDELGEAELAACRVLLAQMPFADRACGFFCDRAALAAWPAFDALQLKCVVALGLTPAPVEPVMAVTCISSLRSPSAASHEARPPGVVAVKRKAFRFSSDTMRRVPPTCAGASFLTKRTDA